LKTEGLLYAVYIGSDLGREIAVLIGRLTGEEEKLKGHFGLARRNAATDFNTILDLMQLV
jgi:hypothetical protein